MQKSLLILILTLTFATPVLAAKKEEEGKETKAGGQYVDLSAVALPVVARGRLVNYVFVSARVVLNTSANTPKVREKEPYFRDALVRAGHRTPFNSGVDYTSIDVAKVQASLFRDAVAIAGAKNIKAVTIISQTPKTRGGLPKIDARSGADEIKP